MKSRFKLNYVTRVAIGLVVSSAGAAAVAQSACDPSKFDCTSGYDIILLVGQSNMTGHYGVDDPNDPYKTNHPQITRWQPTGSVVGGPTTDTNPDYIPHVRSNPGLGPGASFAKSYLQWLQDTGRPNRRVLLVGAANGGTGFKCPIGVATGSWLDEQFESAISNYVPPSDCADPPMPGHPAPWVKTDNISEGGVLYRSAKKRLGDAMAWAKAQDSSSKYAGLIWHQGEADITNKAINETYKANLEALLKGLREHASNVAFSTEGAAGQAAALKTPIVVGEQAPCRILKGANAVPAGKTKEEYMNELGALGKCPRGGQVKDNQGNPMVDSNGNPIYYYDIPAIDPVAYTNFDNILKYQHGISEGVSNAAWVSSAGLTQGDTSHFTGLAQREMGRRYFGKYLEARVGVGSPVVEVRGNLRDGAVTWFNVGMSIDSDPNFKMPRSTGNVVVGSGVGSLTDTEHGHALNISAGTGGVKATLNNIDGTLFNASYTKMAWIQPNGFDGTNRYVLSGADGSQRHTFYATFFFGTDGKPYVRVTAGHNVGGVLREWSSKDVLLQNTSAWVHIAAAFNGEPTDTRMALWVNGVHQTASTATNFGKADPSGVAGLTIQVAGYATGSSSVNTVGLHGRLAQAKVFQKYIGTSAMTAIYAQELKSSTGYGNERQPVSQP